MAAMVQAMTKVREAAPNAGREVIERAVEEIVMRWPEGALGRLNPTSAGKVAKLVVAKFQDTTTLGSLALYIRTCRCVAVASCPNPAGHDEVRKLCAEPLAKEVITEELRQLWKEVTEYWYESRYRAMRLGTGKSPAKRDEPVLTARQPPAPVMQQAKRSGRVLQFIRRMRPDRH
jgi:hypothetical protein